MEEWTMSETHTEEQERQAMIANLYKDEFQRGFVNAMLFSTRLPEFAECPRCLNDGVLEYEDDQERLVCCDCSEKLTEQELPAGDRNYDYEDLSLQLLKVIREDCTKFLAENELPEVHKRGSHDETIENHAGRDFWYTRAGHGCGFWDGDWPEADEDRLTEAAHKFPDLYLWVDEEGQVRSD
jgi:hypothetical protein